MPFRPVLSAAATLTILTLTGWGALAQYAAPPVYRGDDAYGRPVYQRGTTLYDPRSAVAEPIQGQPYGATQPLPPGGPLYSERGPAPDELYDPQQGYNPHQGYVPYPGYGQEAPGAQPPYDPNQGPAVTGGVIRPPVDIVPGGRQGTLASLPVEDQPETGEPKELPPQFKRQTVPYATREPVGSIIIDTPNTYLYYVIGGGQAIRYGIGVGRDGFTWSGVEKITRLAEWPDWHPPAEMIERQPYLPRFMAGGPGNPMGARALYLGKTVYRIHGTNQPSTIGQFVSSGCIRMLNEDVEDLYGRVKVGTKVVVLPGNTPAASNAPIVR
ncbi:MAG: L,D-transpeptidase family protein [Pseudorhodoplanes sp.]